jgi:hypothetical protein
MSKITAAEARKLAGPTVQEQVDLVYPLIREAAEKRKRSITLHDDLWVNGGYAGTVEYKQAVKILENDGFVVEFFYEERQFVNMYTIVKW